MEQTIEQQEERTVREAILYRYKAIALNPYERLTGDFMTETVLSECWEFLTVSNGYWIFRAENKGLAIPANRDALENMNKYEDRAKRTEPTPTSDVPSIADMREKLK